MGFGSGAGETRAKWHRFCISSVMRCNSTRLCSHVGGPNHASGCDSCKRRPGGSPERLWWFSACRYRQDGTSLFAPGKNLHQQNKAGTYDDVSERCCDSLSRSQQRQHEIAGALATRPPFVVPGGPNEGIGASTTRTIGPFISRPSRRSDMAIVADRHGFGSIPGRMKGHTVMKRCRMTLSDPAADGNASDVGHSLAA